MIDLGFRILILENIWLPLVVSLVIIYTEHIVWSITNPIGLHEVVDYSGYLYSNRASRQPKIYLNLGRSRLCRLLNAQYSLDYRCCSNRPCNVGIGCLYSWSQVLLSARYPWRLARHWLLSCSDDPITLSTDRRIVRPIESHVVNHHVTHVAGECYSVFLFDLVGTTMVGTYVYRRAILHVLVQRGSSWQCMPYILCRSED